MNAILEINMRAALAVAVLFAAVGVVPSPSWAQSSASVRTASPEVEAAILRLPIEAGDWEMRRSDMRGGRPYPVCLTQGDWDTAKLRAIGKSLVPPGCKVAAVSLKGSTARTQFTCPDRQLVEEQEFSGKSFRSHSVETSLPSGKTLEIVDVSGKHLGACRR